MDPAAYTGKLAEVSDRFGKPERRRAASALRPTSATAARRLERFVEEGGAMVTTGQQAGLFTGPLYTVYKILTAIRLAESLEAEFGTLVLPVFWVASEDHDWEEVNHAYVMDNRGELHRILAGSSDSRPLPMSDRRFDTTITAAVDQLSYLVSHRPGTDAYLKWIQESYRPDSTVAGAFREVIERLLEHFDVLVTDAADPALKQASIPVLLREAGSVEEHASRLVRRGEELESAGYHVQAPILENAANLFYHGPDGRSRLYHYGDVWRADGAERAFSQSEIEQQLRDEPARFSPNVFLRPVVESYVFPTLAYVGGPGEISYFAQLGSFFEAFGIQPPVVYPRFSALLLEDGIARSLNHLGLTARELELPLHELEAQVARNGIPESVATALRQLRHSLVDGFRDLMAGSREIDPTLDGPLGANRNRILVELARSEEKILRHAKQQHSEQIAALRRARASAFPTDKPQERVLNLFSFLLRHGPELLEELAAAIEIVPLGEPCEEAG